MGVTEKNTNLRGSVTLSGELDNLLNYLVRGELLPGRGVTRVRSSGGRNSLSLGVQSSHFVFFGSGGLTRNERWLDDRDIEGGRFPANVWAREAVTGLVRLNEPSCPPSPIFGP